MTQFSARDTLDLLTARSTDMTEPEVRETLPPDQFGPPGLVSDPSERQKNDSYERALFDTLGFIEEPTLTEAGAQHFGGSSFTNSMKRGNIQGQQTYLGAAAFTMPDKSRFIPAIVDMRKRLRAIPIDPDLQAFHEAGFLEAAKLGLFTPSNWHDVTIPIAAESFVSFFEVGLPLIGGGALAGTAFGPLGTVIGGAIGTGATSNLISSVEEAFGAIEEEIVRRGGNIDDEQMWAQVMNDSDFMIGIVSETTFANLPTSVLDAVSFGVAGRFAAPVKGVLKKGLAMGAETAFIQAPLGGAGQAIQNAIRGQRVFDSSVMAEMIGEIPGGFVETGIGTFIHSREQARQAAITDQLTDRSVQASPLLLGQFDMKDTEDVLGLSINEVEVMDEHHLEMAIETLQTIDETGSNRMLLNLEREQATRQIMDEEGMEVKPAPGTPEAVKLQADANARLFEEKTALGDVRRFTVLDDDTLIAVGAATEAEIAITEDSTQLQEALNEINTEIERRTGEKPEPTEAEAVEAGEEVPAEQPTGTGPLETVMLDKILDGRLTVEQATTIIERAGGDAIAFTTGLQEIGVGISEEAAPVATTEAEPVVAPAEPVEPASAVPVVEPLEPAPSQAQPVVEDEAPQATAEEIEARAAEGPTTEGLIPEDQLSRLQEISGATPQQLRADDLFSVGAKRLSRIAARFGIKVGRTELRKNEAIRLETIKAIRAAGFEDSGTISDISKEPVGFNFETARDTAGRDRAEGEPFMSANIPGTDFNLVVQDPADTSVSQGDPELAGFDMIFTDSDGKEVGHLILPPTDKGQEGRIAHVVEIQDEARGHGLFRKALPMLAEFFGQRVFSSEIETRMSPAAIAAFEAAGAKRGRFDIWDNDSGVREYFFIDPVEATVTPKVSEAVEPEPTDTLSEQFKSGFAKDIEDQRNEPLTFADGWKAVSEASPDPNSPKVQPVDIGDGLTLTNVLVQSEQLQFAILEEDGSPAASIDLTEVEGGNQNGWYVEIARVEEEHRGEGLFRRAIVEIHEFTGDVPIYSSNITEGRMSDDAIRAFEQMGAKRVEGKFDGQQGEFFLLSDLEAPAVSDVSETIPTETLTEPEPQSAEEKQAVLEEDARDDEAAVVATDDAVAEAQTRKSELVEQTAPVKEAVKAVDEQIANLNFDDPAVVADLLERARVGGDPEIVELLEGMLTDLRSDLADLRVAFKTTNNSRAIERGNRRRDALQRLADNKFRQFDRLNAMPTAELDALVEASRLIVVAAMKKLGITGPPSGKTQPNLFDKLGNTEPMSEVIEAKSALFFFKQGQDILASRVGTQFESGVVSVGTPAQIAAEEAALADAVAAGDIFTEATTTKKKDTAKPEDITQRKVKQPRGKKPQFDAPVVDPIPEDIITLESDARAELTKPGMGPQEVDVAMITRSADQVARELDEGGGTDVQASVYLVKARAMARVGLIPMSLNYLRAAKAAALRTMTTIVEGYDNNIESMEQAIRGANYNPDAETALVVEYIKMVHAIAHANGVRQIIIPQKTVEAVTVSDPSEIKAAIEEGKAAEEAAGLDASTDQGKSSSTARKFLEAKIKSLDRIIERARNRTFATSILWRESGLDQGRPLFAVTPLVLPFVLVDLAVQAVAISLKGGITIALAVEQVISDAGKSYAKYKAAITKNAEEIADLATDDAGKVDASDLEAAGELVKGSIESEQKAQLKTRTDRILKNIISDVAKRPQDAPTVAAEQLAKDVSDEQLNRREAAIAKANAKLNDLRQNVKADKTARESYRLAALKHVRKSLDRSEKSQVAWKKLMSLISNPITNQEQFSKLTEAVDAILAEQATRNAQNRLKLAVENSKSVKLGPKFMAFIKDILGDTTIHTKKLSKKPAKGQTQTKRQQLEELDKFIRDNLGIPVVEGRLKELERIEKGEDIASFTKSMTDVEILEITDAINAMVHLNNLVIRTKTEIPGLVAASNVDAMVGEMDQGQANDPFVDEDGNIPDQDTRIGRLVGTFTTAEAMMYAKDFAAHLGNGTKSVFRRVFYNDINAGRDATIAGRIKFEFGVKKILEAHGIDATRSELLTEWSDVFNPHKWMFNPRKKRADEGRAKRHEITFENGKSVKWTVAQFMTVSAMLRDQDTYLAIIHDGQKLRLRNADSRKGGVTLTMEDVNTLRGKLDAIGQDQGGIDLVAISDSIGDLINSELKPALRAWSNKHYGYDITKLGFYFPTLRFGPDIKEGLAIEKRKFHERVTEGLGIGKARDPNATSDFIIEDIFKLSINTAQKTHALINMSEPLNAASRVLRSEAFRDTIRAKRGNKGIQYWETSIKNVTDEAIGPDLVYGEFFRGIMMSLNRNYVLSALGAPNLRVALYQPASLMAASIFVPMPLLIKNFGKAMGRQTEILGKMMLYAPGLYARQVASTTGKVTDTVGSQTSLFGRSAEGHKRMFLIRIFDNLAINTIWLSVTDQVMMENQQNGVVMNDHEVNTEVGRRVDEVVKDTQPTFDPLHQNGLANAARHNVLFSYMALFRSQRSKNINILRSAVQQWKRGEITGGQMTSRFFKVLVAQSLWISATAELFRQAFGFGLLDDWLEGEEELADVFKDIGLSLTQNFFATASGNVLGLGMVANISSRYLMGDPGFKKDAIPAIQNAFEIPEELTKAWFDEKGLSSKSARRHLEIVSKNIMRASGIPTSIYTFPKSIYSNWYADTDKR